MRCDALELLFQSTLPVRGATVAGLPRGTRTKVAFQSTLLVRGATDCRSGDRIGWDISIHAPREGSDEDNDGVIRGYLGISIHAPREGSDMGLLSLW